MQKFMCYCIVFALFLCWIWGQYVSKYKPPGAYICRGDLTECSSRYEFGGLIFGGAYFPNFTVSLLRRLIVTTYLTQPIFKHEYSLNFFIKLLLGVLIEER